MGSADPPILISGGSVKIDFDVSQFEESRRGSFINANKVIKRIEVISDDVNIAEYIADGKVVIKIYYGNR